MGKPRNKKEELAAKYKFAFDECIGDPYAYPEEIVGQYSTLKARSSVAIVEPSKAGGAPSPINRAKPNHLDFFCDVDKAIADGLAAYAKRAAYTLDELLGLFDNTYWLETDIIFTQQERAEIEQQVGRILCARKISPLSKYFTIRK